MKNKRWVITCTLAVILIIFAGCLSTDNKIEPTLNENLIGISMPAQRGPFDVDGDNMKRQLTKAGYMVDIKYAQDNVATQISQLEDMISQNCKVLVITPVDDGSLSSVLADAKAKGIKVVAYDRLIMNTDAVSYYITFNNYAVGTLQGTYIEDKLNLKSRTSADPVYMEFFTGEPHDHNIEFFFGGVMDILTPYMENGIIVCKSGQTTKTQCATPHWSTEKAQERMENLIKSNGYAPNGQKLDAVYCSNDSTAQGVINALQSAGYDSSNIPVITGQDCDPPTMKHILAGLQSMSIFKVTSTLAAKTAEMVDAIMKDTNPTVNDTKTYDNKVKVVPSYLCDPVIVDINNYKKLLIDSGYYTNDQLK